jgi:two-component system, LytTR family, sensor kinase
MTHAVHSPLALLLANKQRAFWILQFAGWAAYALLRYLSSEAFGIGLQPAIAIALATATGFSLTLIMASVFRRVMNKTGTILWLASAGIIIVCAGIFSALEVWAHITFVDPGWRPVTSAYLSVALFDLYVLTSWAGLYYGINYYIMMQAQNQQLLALSAMAHAAQLKMLRYQLNPHFLFNTLNSLSTLVLLGERESANSMLSKLSAFLRYSLAGEPSNAVSLAQEIEALKLYLDIEKTRFQERLQVSFDVETPALATPIPSLLLQPLVENAIKYAVAPQEEGAQIHIAARINHDYLCLSVLDTGPGLPNVASSAEANTTNGVGLSNTRERLSAFYGEHAQLRLKPNTPKGLIITLDIPLFAKTSAIQADEATP